MDHRVHTKALDIYKWTDGMIGFDLINLKIVMILNDRNTSYIYYVDIMAIY